MPNASPEMISVLEAVIAGVERESARRMTAEA
jgi:hypothetical protein